MEQISNKTSTNILSGKVVHGQGTTESVYLKQNESLCWHGIAAQALFAVQPTSDAYRSSFSYLSK